MKILKKYFKEPSYIRYSNCHEDSDFNLKNIKGNPRKILTIASGLDNALSLLLLEPEEVLAIDYNETQIYLCNLKKCAVEHLEQEEFLSLLGMGQDNALDTYEKIKGYLDTETQAYFDSHLFLISQVGLVNCGKFEYYFGVFRRHILSKTHSQKTIDAFVSAESLEEQKRIFNTKFNNLRLRLLFRIFFSKAVMKKLGRDKAFFTYAKGSLAPRLKRQFEQCMVSNLNKDNPYIQYILKGEMKALPTYLSKENYKKIKENIHHLTVRKASFDEVIKEDEKYDFIYLSDIFEYMTEEETASLSKDIYESLNQGGQALLYNMMIERHLCPELKETKLDQTENRTFYYMNCYHYEKN